MNANQTISGYLANRSAPHSGGESLTSVASMFFLIAISLAAVVTNSLALTTIYSCKALHTRSFLLVTCCSVNDLCTGIYTSAVVIAWMFRLVTIESIPLRTCCRIICGTFFMQNFRVLLAVVFSIDRVVAVVLPIFYRSVRWYQFQMPLTVTAVAVSAVESGFLVALSRHENRTVNYCEPDDCWPSEAFLLGHHCLWVVAILSVLVMNLFLICTINCGRMCVAADGDRTVVASYHKKVTKTLSAVVLTTVITQLASRVSLIISHRHLMYTTRAMAVDISRIFIMTNCATNFFVYILSNDVFRSALKELISKRNFIVPSHS